MATARALLAGVLLGLCCAPAAQAASQVYWGNYGGSPATISYADLGGTGGGDVNTVGATVEEPLGLAIDASAGRVYWANDAAPQISFASLAGGGGADLNTTGVAANPLAGIAVDPAGGRLYWGNVSPDAISFANLDGGGAGYLGISGTTVERPIGVAVDPAAGKIYWSNDEPANRISVANLDGSGARDLDTGAANVERPFGVAVDGGRIYWANWNSSTISFANLDGSGGGDLTITGTEVDRPSGIAIDPAAGRIYWTSYTTNKISYANLDGSGGGDLIPPGATVEGPAFPVLLEPPVGNGLPEVAGGSAPSASLSCTRGSWAPDLLASFLYRAPQSFSYQWSRDGSELTGGTASTLPADAVGNYQCRVTATNHAGSATQLSARHGIFKVGRPKLNRRRGTATLPATVPADGILKLVGRGVKTRISRRAGRVKLPIKPKGPKRKRLVRRGRVKIRAIVAFTPAGGSTGSQEKLIRLRKKKLR